MAESSNAHIFNYLMELVAEDKSQIDDEEQTDGILLKQNQHEDNIELTQSDLDDDDYNELDDIIEENLLRKKFKQSNSSSESDDEELFKIMGFEKKKIPKDIQSKHMKPLIESAIQQNRNMKTMLEKLECLIIVRLRHLDLFCESDPAEHNEPIMLIGDFYSKFTSPYFRDGHFPCPPNTDQRIKENLSKPLYADSHLHETWDVEEMAFLEDAIKDQIVDDYLKVHDKINKNASRCEPDTLSKIHQIRNNPLDDTLKERNISKIDWERVSTLMAHPHSSRDCEVLWNVYLSPTINKSLWDKPEILELVRIAKAHRFRNWDKIAEELKTSRSGYICFIQYHRKIDKSGKKWNDEELSLLEKIVQACKIGDQINWSKVMYYYDFYDFNQLYYKFYKTFKLSGELPRKGKFDFSEDQLIVHAVKKEGLPLPMVSKLLTSRNSCQIRERYSTLVRHDRKTGGWTKEEDMKLMQLVEEHGTGNWAQIAQKMENRTRIQVRQHYQHIHKIIKKNPNLSVENYRSRKIYCTKRLRDKKLFKKINETDHITDIARKDKEEIELLRYFAHERKVLEMRQSIHSTFESNHEKIISLCNLLGIEFPDKPNYINSDVMPLQEYVHEAFKFVDRNHSELINCNSEQDVLSFMPPNLISFNSFRNIFFRLDKERYSTEKLGELELPREDPVFNKAMEKWYRRLLIIFGSSLSIWNINLPRLEKALRSVARE